VNTKTLHTSDRQNRRRPLRRMGQ